MMSERLLPLYNNGDFERDPISVVGEKIVQEHVDPLDKRSPFQRDCSRLIHSPSFRKLQGKTQIFPGLESDFLRNRLTHSMEVADIGKSVALRVNDFSEWSGIEPINLDLVEFACLAHDLGHPPFGHVGERALNDCMLQFGKFEGNAQTFRILARIEKKRTLPDSVYSIYVNQGFDMPIGGGKYRDLRKGLNLTSRSLASVLKYDNCIENGDLNKKLDSIGKGVVKGYYEVDLDTIDAIKEDVTKAYDQKTVKKALQFSDGFKTIECSIMDLADDIAYTVFDLEDALKSGFINLLDIISIGSNDGIGFFETFSKRITKDKHLRKYFDSIGILEGEKPIYEANGVKFYDSHRQEIQRVLTNCLLIDRIDNKLSGLSDSFSEIVGIEDEKQKSLAVAKTVYISSGITHNHFKNISGNAYFRNRLTTWLVTYFLNNIQLKVNTHIPALSSVYLDGEAIFLMEIIKQYVFVSQVKSTRVQLVEFRGQEMIKKIFETLSDQGRNAQDLMPADYRIIYKRCENDEQLRHRVICDFIGGMTDKYAVEFYCRLYGENPQSFFKSV